MRIAQHRVPIYIQNSIQLNFTASQRSKVIVLVRNIMKDCSMDNAFRDWFKRDTGCIIIGEIGVNHNGELKLAKDMIDVAIEAGADAVKFQTFTAEKLVTATAEKANYQKVNDEQTGSQFDMLKRLEFSREDLIACREYCQNRGIAFLSTPFDEDAVDLLSEIGVHGYKVSSGDLTNLPLLAHMAAKGKPVIISTGMANLADVEEAVETIKRSGNPPLAILHCVSNYPAAPEEANLKAMDTLRAAFAVPIGWSDHTLGDEIAIAAIARGAEILEKHFTLDVNLPGPDHKASLNPKEFMDLTRKIRAVDLAIGTGIKQAQPSEIGTARIARRSLVAAQNIKSGEIITKDMIICKRPGTGLMPKYLPLILGKRAARDLKVDSLIDITDVQ